MRCQWMVRRTMQRAPEGQRRWDRAYREVLAWMEGPADEPVGASRRPGAREAGHEGGALYARVSTRRQAQAQTVELGYSSGKLLIELSARGIGSNADRLLEQ